MSRTLYIIASAACFIIGAASFYSYYHGVANPAHCGAEPEESWINLSAPSGSGESPVSYSSEALFKSDIPLPKVQSLAGKAKFIKNPAGTAPGIKLGYVIDVDIASSAASELPARYQTPEEKDPSLKAPHEAYYDVIFYFILKDKDGFPLMKATSNRESVHSGGINHIQLFANSFIPPAAAANTKMIDVRMEVLKSLSQQPDSMPSEPRKKRQRFSLF